VAGTKLARLTNPWFFSFEAAGLKKLAASFFWSRSYVAESAQS
jgi:hypothetical protein